jgi:hypothetical protein
LNSISNIFWPPYLTIHVEVRSLTSRVSPKIQKEKILFFGHTQFTMKFKMMSISRLFLLHSSLLLLLVTTITTTTTTVQAWIPATHFNNNPRRISLPSSFSISWPLLSVQISSSSSSSSRNSNVILRPSDDPAAFDSFKVGNARVHRYSRDQPGDKMLGDTEYVMWYHGRSRQETSPAGSTATAAAKLPPLSTGRIGRATSRNGLVWQKVVEGSASEDAPDVSLGCNKESWWGFDTAHVGLGNVLLPMSTPGTCGFYIKYVFTVLLSVGLYTCTARLC